MVDHEHVPKDVDRNRRLGGAGRQNDLDLGQRRSTAIEHDERLGELDLAPGRECLQ